jgi:glycosyltransferase involved in cell wall biosynthesis
VPPEDPGALAATVLPLLHDPERLAAIGEAARRRIEVTFPLQRMIDGYETALGELIDPGA